MLRKTDWDIHGLKKLLNAEKSGKVVLRFDIEPEKYWNVRKKLEEGLAGSRTLHLFGFGDDILLCEKIKRQ